MDADAEDNAAVLGNADVALDHRVLNFYGATHGVDDAAELDDRAVAGALDDAPAMHGDSRVDQIAAQRPEPRQNAILVSAGEPAIADHVRAKDRRQFPGLDHSASPPAPRLAQTGDQSTPMQLTEGGPEPIARMTAMGRNPSVAGRWPGWSAA